MGRVFLSFTLHIYYIIFFVSFQVEAFVGESFFLSFYPSSTLHIYYIIFFLKNQKKFFTLKKKRPPRVFSPLGEKTLIYRDKCGNFQPKARELSPQSLYSLLLSIFIFKFLYISILLKKESGPCGFFYCRQAIKKATYYRLLNTIIYYYKLLDIT